MENNCFASRPFPKNITEFRELMRDYNSTDHQYIKHLKAKWNTNSIVMAFIREEICLEKMNAPIKEYWYYLVWTYKDDSNIEAVRANIEKVIGRAKKLGIYYMDISFEHGDKSGREHYNMRIKSHKMVPKNRFKYYTKDGGINYTPVHVKTEENWNNLGNYCSKENMIEILVDERIKEYDSDYKSTH